MAEYKYIGKTIEEKTVKGHIQGISREDVYEQLKKKGIFTYDLQEIKRTAFKKFKMKAKDLSEFSRQLGIMLSAGVPITRALNILYSQAEKKKIKSLYEKIIGTINKGHTMSTAMEGCQGIFPELMINMYKAGESNGSLDEAALKMADFYEKEHKINTKIKGAMVYPAILMSLTILVTLFLFTFVIPRFVGLLGEKNLPLITKVLLAISRFLTGYWHILILIITLLALIFYFLLGKKEVKMKIDKMKLRLPIAGKLLSTIYTARFARTLSSLYGSGVNMIDAIRGSANTLGNLYMTNEFTDVIEKVKEGNPLSTTINKIPGIEKKLSAGILIGEETGKLDNILSIMAVNYEYESEAATSRLVSLVEPIMIIVMTVVVGTILLGVMLPMMTSYGSLLK